MGRAEDLLKKNNAGSTGRASSLLKKDRNEVSNAASKAALEELNTTGQTTYRGKTYTAPVIDNTPTFGERVKNTVAGGLLGSGAGFTNTLGSITEGLGNIGDRLQDKREQRQAAQELQYIELYKQQLSEARKAGDKTAEKNAQIRLNQAEYRLKSLPNIGDMYTRVNEEATQKVYKKADELSEKSQKKIERAKENTGAVGEALVDIGAAGTQLLGDIATGVVTGTGAMAPIFIRGFGSGAQQARQNGATYEQQLAYGLGSATVEALTEKIASVGSVATKAFGKGALDDITKGVIRAVEDQAKTAAGKQAINRLASIGTGFVGEGLEEAVSAMIDPLLQRATYSDEKIDWEQAAHDAAYQFLIGGVLGGVMGGIGGTDTSTVDTRSVKADNKNTPAPVSPAASPEVQQVQAQAEVTKAQNPEAEVLDAATTLFTQQGMSLKTAQKRAEIVGKLVRGEEVSDKDLNKIDPTNNQTKAIFTQLTGVQFPAEATSIETLRDLYRSAHDVAEAAKAQVATVAENATVESLAKQMEQSGYQTSPETQTRIDEENSKLANQVANLDIGPDGKPLANLSTFAEAYRSKIDPNATDEVVREKYAEFRNASRTILFGGHRLTKNQFTKLMRDNGKNLTDEQVNTLFNQAILDTLDGKDAFDRYTKKEAKTDGRTDARAEDGNSGQVVREQSDRRGDRDGGRQSGVDDASDRRGSGETPGQSAHLQSGQDQHVGRVNEEGSNDRKGQNQNSERDAQSRRAGDRTDRAESDDQGGRGSSERETGESGTDENGVHEREKQPRLQSRKAQPLGLSGLKSPRTSKVKIPGIFGKVKAVDKADYTATMKAADEFVSSIGYQLIVTTDSFRTSLLEGFDACDGLHDSENKIITVSAKETDSSDFYTTFMHEMFHVYVDKKNFQSKFLSKVCTYAKLPGANTRSEVYEFILGEALTNKYLSDYKQDFIRWGYTDEEIEFNIMDEMFAEIRSGSNANLALDEAVFDELESAAYTAWKEVAPAYTKALQHGVVRDKLKEDSDDRGKDLLNEGLHGRDYQRPGERTGSVQQEKRGTEASDGRGLEARNSSAGEVRVREDETAHRAGSGTDEKRSRGQKEAKALNIASKKAEIPTFKSWNDAFLYFEHGAGESTGLSFAEPPAFADEMSVGKGKPWKEVKTYPKTEAGLKTFQSEVDSLLNGGTETESETKVTEAVPDFVGKSHVDSFVKKKENAKKVTVDGHEYDAVSLRDYTGAMKLIRRQAKDAGFSIEFVFGGIKSEGHKNVLGLTVPAKRQIIVNVYDVEYLKTARHELFHAYTYINPSLHKRILDRVYDEDLGDVFVELYAKFAEDWSGYNDKNIDEWTLRFAIENEIFAEAFAKSTAHSAQVRKFVDIVREEVDPWLDTWNPTEKELSKKLGYPTFDTLVEWYGEELNGFSVEDLSDESMDFGEMYRFAPSTGDALTEYLNMIKESYGDEMAQDMFDAFETMELSRRVAEVMSEIEASVGAAKSGFDPYSHLQNEYGTIEPGERPARDIDVPISTNGEDKVSKTVRTVSEAKATPDSRLETIEQATVDGKLSYIPIKNKVEARKAEYKIKALGWADALAEWTAEARQGYVSARLIAEGATLLNNAGNHPECTGVQYTSLLVDYTNMLRVAGQATQAARILKTLSPDATLYTVEKMVQNINDHLPESLRNLLPDGVKVDESLIEEYRNAKTAKELEEIMDRILQNIADQIPSTLMDKFTALRYLNMLGNFKTQVRNVVGNAMFIPVRRTKDTIGAIIEGALVARGKDIERTKSITRDKATYHACVKDYEVVRDIVMGGGKYDDSRKYAREIEDKRRIFKSKFLESYRKATNWAMNNKYFGDEGFSRFAYADAMARYLAANKVTYEQASHDMLDKAREYAIQQAAEATYRDNNAFSTAISQMRFRNPDNWAKKGINTVADGLLPFRRTPANILVRAIEYNPIGFISTAVSNIYGVTKKGETLDATRLIEQLSKNLTGTGICMVGYLLYSLGLLRGKEPEEDKLAQYEELLGHQAYSIELPNGVSLTLDWMAPASIPMFLGAQFADAALENGLTFREGLEALGSITDPMLQMSMLQGVNDALENASTYGNESALVRLTGNSLWSFATQGLTNTLLGQIERSLSNDRTTTYVDKNKDVPDALQRLLGKASAKTPGWDYSQIPYIDAWGRVGQNAETAVGNALNQFFNPAYTSRVEESKMEAELRRLYEATGASGVLPSRAKSYFNVDKKRLDLTAEQYVDYATMKGQTSYAILEDLTSDSLYKELPDEIKEKAVVKVMDFANEISKAEVSDYAVDKWVNESAEDADKYGIPVATYALASAQISVITGIKDDDGETISGSKAVQKALVIRKLGLSDKQTEKLMEDFDVGKDYKNMSEKNLQKKLDKWSK